MVDPVASHRINSIAATILPPAKRRVHDHDDHGKNITSQDGRHAQRVEGCLVGLEELRSDDVGHAIGDEDEGVHRHLLGVAGCVGRVQAQAHNVRAKIKVRHVERGQAALEVVQRQDVEEDGRDEADDDAEQNPSGSALPLGQVLGREEDTAVAEIRRYGLDDTRRHHEKSRPLRRISQSSDDERRKVGQATVGDGDDNVEHEHEPGLGVGQGLDELILLELLVLDARLVGTQTINHNRLLPLRDKLGLDGVIRQEEAHDTRPHDCHAARDPEHGAPLVLPGEEADAPADGPREADGQARVHEAGAEGLLAAGVPHAEDEEVTGDDGGLEGAEEDAQGDEGGEVVGEAGGDEDATPDELDDEHELGDGESLQEAAAGETPEEVAKLE